MALDGPRIAEISVEEFQDFVKRYATSPEIGPIKTSLDDGADQEIDFERILVGLWGCESLCAVACFHLHQSVMDKSRHGLKLDSVIVDSQLRRRGLAGLLVAQSFIDLVFDSARKVSSVYAHSVHPATVRLLRRLRFNDPQATGAPISDIKLEGDDREAFLMVCEEQIDGQLNQMKLQCVFCLKGDRRARPWCLPRGEKPSFR